MKYLTWLVLLFFGYNDEREKFKKNSEIREDTVIEIQIITTSLRTTAKVFFSLLFISDIGLSRASF